MKKPKVDPIAGLLIDKGLIGNLAQTLAKMGGLGTVCVSSEAKDGTTAWAVALAAGPVSANSLKAFCQSDEGES